MNPQHSAFVLVILILTIIPIVLGIKEARRKGISPHWMWFGLLVIPIGGWITYLVIRSKVKPSNEADTGKPKTIPELSRSTASEHLPKSKQLKLWVPQGMRVRLFVTKTETQGMLYMGDGAVTTALRACPHCQVPFKSRPEGTVVRLDESRSLPENQGFFCPACNQEILAQQFEAGSEITPGDISNRLETTVKWNVPTPLDEETYVRRCLETEFRDETESRTFRDDQAFNNVLALLNSQRYDKAIQEAKKLLPKYVDFDLVYKWLGMAYRATQQLVPSRQVLSEGLEKSKRKCFLLTDMGETELQSGNIENTLYWLAQALHCLSSNPMDYNVYLLLNYIAAGAGLPDAAVSFLARVDALRAGRIRLPSEPAERLTNLARRGRTEPMRKVIQGLKVKYLSA